MEESAKFMYNDDDDKEKHQSPGSEVSSIVSSTVSSSPFRRRNFNGKTRRQAWERLKNKKGLSPRRSPPQLQHHHLHHELHPSPSVEEELARTAPPRPTFSADADDEKKSSITGVTAAMDETDTTETMSAKLPQHSREQFYRVVYRGVVALVSQPDSHSTKTGAYVSYGEIVASRQVVEVEEYEDVQPESEDNKEHQHTNEPPMPASPPRSVFSQHAESVSTLATYRTASSIGPKQTFNKQSVLRKAIQVDRVMTGGYSIDGAEQPIIGKRLTDFQTPRRSNVNPVTILGPSPLPLASPFEDDDGPVTEKLGYLFSEKKQTLLLEPLMKAPQIESGKYVYRVVSSTPLPILTGPCIDAPKTKAMLLPGTCHDVCLKMWGEGVVFLRLTRRRGWITDRKYAIGSEGAVKLSTVASVQEVVNTNTDDSTISALSINSVPSPGTLVKRRHRPPRRKRQQAHKKGADSSSFVTPSKKAAPVNGPIVSPLPLQTAPPDKANQSCNVSVLSFDDDVSESTSKYKSFQTPDRSIALNSSSYTDELPTVFLMRVNAPRGLKILDAPHFQVSTLIRGKLQPKTSDRMSPIHGSHSIFQTMTSHVKSTTTKVGNPAVFDTVKKTRILPRGAIFEASSRMEQSGSYSQGLIKLSDKSGWAIIPRQDELDMQYRTFHGGVASVKEGEATRAFEEIGNAIINPDVVEDKIYWVRVMPRQGITVECTPAMAPTLNDIHTSPTSSTGGGSSISGAGSNYGGFVSHDSDVTSSVGSAFLDAMFKTPRKREAEKGDLENRKPQLTSKKGASSDTSDSSVSSLLVCGAYFQIDKWTASNPILDNHKATQVSIGSSGPISLNVCLV